MATLYTQSVNEHADGSLIYLCHLGISKEIEQSVCSFRAFRSLSNDNHMSSTHNM